MKPDIAIIADIEILIDAFYTKVKADKTISFIFNDVMKVNWEHRIPVIVDFWETLLLDHPIYNKMRWQYIIISIKNTHARRVL